MVSQVHVVTDGSALFVDPGIIRRYNITVVPAYVSFGNTETYRLGIEIGPEDFIHRIQYGATPHISPPTPQDFLEVYKRLNLRTTQVISIHTSSRLHQAYQNAKIASKMLMGRCDIAVIDSMTISAGVGILVEQAARLSMIHTQLEDVVRDLRRMISGVYSVFFVESMQTICKHGLMGEAQTILGTMLGIMPFITVEDGELVIMEKARSHTQAVDKLVEFATEFTDIERLVILNHTLMLTDSVRMLQDRLALELPRMDFPTRVYDGILANYLGPDALGITIFENPEEE